MTDKLDRREFLRRAGAMGLSTYGLSRLAGDELLDLIGEAEAATRPTLSVASRGRPEVLVKKAIDGLGGIKKFVKRGSRVVIKPNIAWARTPAQAANTDPQVVAALIKLCRDAGARSILIIDHTCDRSAMAFELSGMKKMAAAEKVRLVSAHNKSMYRAVKIPKGKILKSSDCIKDVLDADVFINVPIAKVHGATAITASMKNLMGVTYARQPWHNSRDLQQCIADYASVVKPDLIVLDAVRVLLTRGPKGPGDTKKVGKVVAGTDPVAIDAYATTLLGKSPSRVKHIVYASKMGLGQMDLKQVNVRKV